MRRCSRCLQTSGFKGSPIMASKRKRCASQREIADILAEEDSETEDLFLQSKKGVREVDKPSLQAQYNKYMGGVDLLDQFCSTYTFNHRSKKWYQTLWHFVIEVALVNSKISYNLQNRKKLTQVVFRQEVIKGLLEGYNTKPRRKNVVRDLVENKKYLPNLIVVFVQYCHLNVAKKERGHVRGSRHHISVNSAHKTLLFVLSPVLKFFIL
ncbi:uncharacterized protein [Palaemon carinicauda]|uniref:uncharacterized protein n=1 Tax=Palaemon carinicauda TaxID=392227 RepID=UPI0035B5BD41